MSLIMDATKAAQREKERREGGLRDKVPVLVPLRTKARSEFSWQRMATIAIGGAVIVSAGVIVFQATRDSVPRALKTPGPTVVSIATPPGESSGVSEIAKAPATPPPATTTAATVDSKAPATAPASTPRRTPVEPRPVPARRPATPPAVSRGTESPGLHITVDQPNLAEAARLFAIGVAAHRSGDLAAARSAYGRVLVLSPTDVDALNNLGVLLLTLREFDQAEQVLRRAVSLGQTNAGAWNNLGTVLRERGRSAEAIAAFQRALAIDPRHDGAKVSLAQQYLVISSLGQARQLLEEVTASNPAHPEANYALGQVLERLGDKPGAIRAYEAFIRNAPPALAAYVENVRRRVEALAGPR
jgi:Tfp pilus assembly protein PilF